MHDRIEEREAPGFMLGKTPLVLGDWGTSELRLFLIRDNKVVDNKSGIGIGYLKRDCGEYLAELLAEWRTMQGKDEPFHILMCGMVGSNIGWHEVAYCRCPVGEMELSSKIERKNVDWCSAWIIPGISCTNLSGVTDFMRGEETQIVGAIKANPNLRLGRNILCLPGTHTKWAILENGRVMGFHTSLTGEVFSLLRSQSVLLRSLGKAKNDQRLLFLRGVERARETRGVGLLAQLFETRSIQIELGVSSEDAEAFLSGLVLGHDIAGMIELGLFQADDKKVTVVGSPILAPRFAKALAVFDLQAHCVDGDQMAANGLLAIAQAAWSNDTGLSDIARGKLRDAKL